MITSGVWLNLTYSFPFVHMMTVQMLLYDTASVFVSFSTFGYTFPFVWPLHTVLHVNTHEFWMNWKYILTGHPKGFRYIEGTSTNVATHQRKHCSDYQTSPNDR